MKNKLIKIANTLDKLGYYNLANEVDDLIKNANTYELDDSGVGLYNKIHDNVYDWIQKNHDDHDYTFKTIIAILENILTKVKMTRDIEKEAKETWLKDTWPEK